MAFDLTARLKLIDQMTKPLRDVIKNLNRAQEATRTYRDAQGRLRDEQGRFVAGNRSVSSSLRNLHRNMNQVASAGKKVFSGVVPSGLTGQLAGIGTALVSVGAAKKGFESTIGAAAQYELDRTTVNALFGNTDKKTVDDYFNFLDQKAAESMFKFNDFLNMGKSFIPLTKDLGQLKTLADITERLASSNPEQGVSGGTFALAELFSGDAQSIIERFRVPRDIANAIKKLKFTDQLKAMDAYLTSRGWTKGLLSQQSMTALGQWNQITDKVSINLRKMGYDGLEKIKPLLNSVNNWLDRNQNKLISFGGDIVQFLSTKAVNAFRTLGKYVDTNFFNNPAFSQLDAQAKVAFIFDTVYNDIQKWLNEKGSAQLQNAADSIVDKLVNGLQVALPKIIPIAVTIGEALASGIASGLKSGLSDIPILGGFVSDTIDWGADIVDYFNTNMSLDEKIARRNARRAPAGIYGPPDVSSHHTGMNRVPYNGYQASLHQDEMILNRSQAQAYRNGGNSGVTVSVTGNTFNVRQESDIDAIAKAIAQQINSLGGAVHG